LGHKDPTIGVRGKKTKQTKEQINSDEEEYDEMLDEE